VLSFSLSVYECVPDVKSHWNDKYNHYANIN
jgi:hypothetical protein